MSRGILNKTFHKKWKVIEKINQGGQASVYKVVNLEDDKFYALKLFHLKKFQKKKLTRIQTEINIIKKLNGKNVVKVYDDNLQEVIDSIASEVFYVMDYAQHGSLKDNDFYFNDAETALRIFKEILVGVNTAHRAGVIHRDLKPENILLFPNQKSVMVTDFGVGLLKDQINDNEVTEKDEVVGPLHFISPEQYKNPSNADEKSDIYSLGKILMYLLTGKSKIFREELGSLSTIFEGSNPYLPLIEENLLKKMVIEDKMLRFSNVAVLIEEVNQILNIISDNSKRYLKRNDERLKFYEALIGSDRANFVDDFIKDLMFSLKILEWGLIDLSKEGKAEAAKNLIDEIKSKHKDVRVQMAVDCVNMYVNNPKELQSIEKQETKFSFPFFYLSKYFFNNKSYKISHEYIEKALELELDPEITLAYLLHLSDICKRCKCSLKHNFDDRLKTLLQETDDIKRKTTLYRILGKHYIEAKENKKGLLFLEAYLDLEPFDEDIRFECAYQYTQVSETALSFYHYSIALKNTKDISTITNNLGVLYGNEGMPIKSMKMYEKSFKLGSTLAGSNIAKLYLQIGLLDKALDLLRNIIRENKSSYDSGVDRTLGSVEINIEEEDKKEEKLNSTGSLLNQYHTRYIEQLTSKSKYDWVGIWELKVKNRKFIIEIKEEEDNLLFQPIDDPDIKINGRSDGNCFELKNIVLNTSYYSDEKYDNGYIYMINENQFEGYLSKGANELIEINGTRVTNLEQYRNDNKTPLDALSQALAMRAKLAN